MNPKTHFNDIASTVLAIFPDAELSEDADGQLIVHTGLISAGDDMYSLLDAIEGAK